MKRSFLNALAGGVLLAAAAGTAPLAAQDHTAAAGYGPGFIRLGDLNPGAAGTTLALDAGWVVSGFGEAYYMAGGRLGTRVNAAFSQRPLQLPEEQRDVNLWLGDANLMIRLLAPDPQNLVAPFLSVGGGFIRYGLGRGPALQLPEADALYAGDEQTQWTLVGGAGIDIYPEGFGIPGSPLGIRLEAANHFTPRSPFERIEGGRYERIHNLRFGISLIGLGWF